MKVAKFAGAHVVKGGKILLVQEAHEEAYGLWSLPLGHVDDGEKESETAKRETKEETGYDVTIIGESKTLKIKGEDFKSTSNFNNSQINLVVFDGKILGGSLLKGEDILDAKWFSLDEISKLNLRGEWVKYFLN